MHQADAVEAAEKFAHNGTADAEMLGHSCFVDAK